MTREILNRIDFSAANKFLPVDYFLNPSSRVFWLYLLSSAVIALLFAFFSLTVKKKSNWTNSKAYWLSNSALLDYKYFFVIWFFKVYIISPFIFSAKFIAIHVFWFVSYFFPPLFLHWEKKQIAFFYTFALFLLSDFTRYWLHRWFHRNKLLWQFHKVHHSATSLNPFTFYRTHPVENFLFGTRYAITAGFVTGVFFWLFGASLSITTLFGSNIFIVFFSLAGANLRHSHIRLSYPSWLEKIFISPSQHQLHHSIYATHKNFGGYLSLWDNLFGSLLHTKDAPTTNPMGIIEKQKIVHYDSIKQLLWQPFANIFLSFKPITQGENTIEKKYSTYVPSKM